jgi:hypothetical protein
VSVGTLCGQGWPRFVGVDVSFFFLSSWYCGWFELRASHLLGRRATLEPTTSIISVSTWFVDHSTHLFEGSALVWFSV